MKKPTFAQRVAGATTIEEAMNLWREENFQSSSSAELSKREHLALSKAVSLAQDTFDLDRILENYFETHAHSATYYRHHIRIIFARADDMQSGN